MSKPIMIYPVQASLEQKIWFVSNQPHIRVGRLIMVGFSVNHEESWYRLYAVEAKIRFGEATYEYRLHAVAGPVINKTLDFSSRSGKTISSILVPTDRRKMAYAKVSNRPVIDAF